MISLPKELSRAFLSCLWSKSGLTYIDATLNTAKFNQSRDIIFTFLEQRSGFEIGDFNFTTVEQDYISTII